LGTGIPQHKVHIAMDAVEPNAVAASKHASEKDISLCFAALPVHRQDEAGQAPITC
jgi:hypothetical protein